METKPITTDAEKTFMALLRVGMLAGMSRQIGDDALAALIAETANDPRFKYHHLLVAVRDFKAAAFPGWPKSL